MLNDDKYPEKLRIIDNPPQKLYYKGNIDLLNKDSIAIIGSRVNSEYGKKMASKFSKELASYGLVVVSGMAKGIDGIAHEACLEVGGKTIAVLGCGVEVIYPKENEKIYNEILRNDGLIISEYEPYTEADSKYFPQRNRIVSGLSIGTLVIESVHRSGTSITAGFALEQGRNVFCIPHQLETKTGVGNNRLIQQGAKLVTCVEDILIEYNNLNIDVINMENITPIKEVKEEYRVLYDALDKKMTIDMLCKKLKCPVGDINYLITMMEIENIIEILPGNIIKRK